MCELPGCTQDPREIGQVKSIRVSLTSLASPGSEKDQTVFLCEPCYHQFQLRLDSEEADFEQAFEEYEEVRRSGACNMLDRQCVRQEAHERDLEELLRAMADGTYTDIIDNFGE